MRNVLVVVGMSVDLCFFAISPFSRYHEFSLLQQNGHLARDGARAERSVFIRAQLVFSERTQIFCLLVYLFICLFLD